MQAFDVAHALNLHGRTSLVTGGGSGIGAGICHLLAAAGAVVVVADVVLERAEEVALAISAAGGHAMARELDVACFASIEALRCDLEAAGTQISILVNNAGVSGELPLDHEDVGAMWDRQIAVNLSGTFHMSRAFAPVLGATNGCIVNLASVTSFVANTRSFSYVASKGGVKMLTQVLAKELAASGVRVNAVAPGGIDTPLLAKRKQDTAWMSAFYERTPLGRLGTPDEVARGVLFLVSPLAAYVTGIVLPIDGGFLAT